MYTMEHYSAIKNKEKNAIYSNMNGHRDYHTKWSNSEREKYRVGQKVCQIFPQDGMQKPEQTF